MSNEVFGQNQFQVSVSSLTLGTLYEAILSFSREESFAAFWPSVCRNARWLLPSKRAAILLTAEDETGERTGECRLVGTFARGNFVAVDRPLTPKTAETLVKPRALWLREPANALEQIDAEFLAWILEESPQCVFALPLREKDRPAGALVFVMDEVQESDQTMLTALGTVYAQHVGMSISLLKSGDEKRLREEELDEARKQLVESEKMAALGQLISGIAHEINTPLGVIRASIGNINDSMTSTLRQLPRLFRALSPEQMETFKELLRRSHRNKQNLSSREEREIARKLTRALEEHGVPDARDTADNLVDMGIYQDIEPFTTLFKEMPESIHSAYDLAAFQNNSTNILTAIERASKVVFALKKFAHQDHSEEKSPADIAEGIETVLTLYQNQLKQGVEVVRNFQELPPIYCYPDELNQVWTNLIHNALHAMDNQGRLEIDLRRDGDRIVVAIIDSGRGIPPEIQDRIFKPFFTTKGRGEGSGLGLDITRKIIDHHEGEIQFESRPGRTTFTVLIPAVEQKEGD